MGFLLFLFCLPFPFLMFACLFETNFPNIPFLKPKLLSFLAVLFFFCCSCFCVHGVHFGLSVSMLALFFVFFCIFVFLLLGLLSIYEKNGFSLQFWCFWVMLVKRVVWFLCFMFFVLVCFSCVVCFHLKEFICIILFLCFFITRLSGLLVCILWSFFFFCFLLFCFEFVFFHSSQKRPPKNRTQQKPKKNKKTEKNGQKIS